MFLEISSYYDPGRLICDFPFDGLLEERALLLGRMGKHEQALFIYVHILKDTRMAEEYCHKHYDQNKDGNKDVYLSLLRMYLSPPSIHCLGPIKLELLEPKANLQAALQVLELHHSKLDTTKALNLLPANTQINDIRIRAWNAYDKFKDKRVGTKGLDFSDRIGKTKRTGYESGEYEMLGEGLGVKETPQQKYQRLLHEVQELTTEVEKIKTTVKESATEEKLTPVVLAKQLAALKQQLVASHLEKLLGPDAAINLTDPDGALAKRLLLQLEATKNSKGGSGGKTTGTPQIAALSLMNYTLGLSRTSSLKLPKSQNLKSA